MKTLLKRLTSIMVTDQNTWDEPQRLKQASLQQSMNIRTDNADSSKAYDCVQYDGIIKGQQLLDARSPCASPDWYMVCCCPSTMDGIDPYRLTIAYSNAEIIDRTLILLCLSYAHVPNI